MPTTLEEDSMTCTLRLNGEIDISGALELKHQIQIALDSRKNVSVDLAGVVGLDITGMQLLWAAAADANTAGSTIRFNEPVSEQAAAAFSQAGLDSLQGRQK